MKNNSLIIIFLCIYLLPVILLVLYVIWYLLKRLRIKLDYSKANFKCISGLIFMKYCKLPKNREFFQKTLYNTDSILPTVLPKINMNDYDFDDVFLSNCIFTKNTILPKDPEFFQKIKNKEISHCTLPRGDYSFYNFKGVYLYAVNFHKGSTMPLTHSFFRDLKNHYVLLSPIPKTIQENCHLYDFSETSLYSNKLIKISPEQECLIRLKNKDCLYPFIKDSSNKRKKSLKNIFKAKKKKLKK